MKNEDETAYSPGERSRWARSPAGSVTGEADGVLGLPTAGTAASSAVAGGRPRRNGGILSPEKSSSRTVARRPASRQSIGVSRAMCSAGVGQASAPRKGISVRSSPTPAAPAASPRLTSAADAALHITVISWPSLVRTDAPGWSPVRAGPSAVWAVPFPADVTDPADVAETADPGGAAARSAGLGPTMSSPASASSRPSRPAGAARTAGSTPAIIGTPRPRAMIAACELAPPVTETAPVRPGVGKLDQVGRADLAARPG